MDFTHMGRLYEKWVCGGETPFLDHKTPPLRIYTIAHSKHGWATFAGALANIYGFTGSNGDKLLKNEENKRQLI